MNHLNLGDMPMEYRNVIHKTHAMPRIENKTSIDIIKSSLKKSSMNLTIFTNAVITIGVPTKNNNFFAVSLFIVSFLCFVHYLLQLLFSASHKFFLQQTQKIHLLS